ncbi:MAG: HIT family protein, partial [Thermoplasmata archaeon]
GVLLLQTKRHASDRAALTESESARLGVIISGVSRALKACADAAWPYCFGFTEAYRHVHLVIVSRYPNAPSKYVRLAITDWPDAPRDGPDEVAHLCRRLRAFLANP